MVEYVNLNKRILFVDDEKYGMKKREGFSLIEMVIVISIIGVLAGIIAIKFSGAQQRAKENADYANAANIATAYYLAESQGENKEDIDSVEELVSGKFLESAPKAQSVGEVKNFTIETSSGELLIKAGNKQFYPRDKE